MSGSSSTATSTFGGTPWPRKMRRTETTSNGWSRALLESRKHKASENPLHGRVCPGHPAGVPPKVTFRVSFSKVKNRKSLGHQPVDPCLSRRMFQGHPAVVPGFEKKKSMSFSRTVRHREAHRPFESV